MVSVPPPLAFKAAYALLKALMRVDDDAPGTPPYSASETLSGVWAATLAGSATTPTTQAKPRSRKQRRANPSSLCITLFIQRSNKGRFSPAPAPPSPSHIVRHPRDSSFAACAIRRSHRDIYV